MWDHDHGTNALSPAEMETLLEGTGRRVAKRYEVDGARFYAAVIERVD